MLRISSYQRPIRSRVPYFDFIKRACGYKIWSVCKGRGFYLFYIRRMSLKRSNQRQRGKIVDRNLTRTIANDHNWWCWACWVLLNFFFWKNKKEIRLLQKSLSSPNTNYESTFIKKIGRMNVKILCFEK